MRRVRLALIVVAMLALAVVGAILLLRAVLGTVDHDKARDEAQALFDRTAPGRATVERCRSATEEDVDSPTIETFVCTVSGPTCTSDEIIVVPRAAKPGQIDSYMPNGTGPPHFDKGAPTGQPCR
jgi:hypothetical protein